LILKCNGNTLTKKMHLCTLRELEHDPEVSAIAQEEVTSLGNNALGAYDFVADSSGKKIGVEVMTRPTKGKLKEKLRYKENVDQFIFVIPKQRLCFYEKEPFKVFPSKARKKFFPSAFSDPKLLVWVYDMETGKIEKKERFSRAFNVER